MKREQTVSAASYIVSFSIALILGLCLFFESKVSAQGELATNLPAGFATRSDYLKSLTNGDVISAAYQKGYISKAEASQALTNRLSSQHFTDKDALHRAYDLGIIGRGEAMALETIMDNHRSLNLYGRVIDQNGQPVAGVDVTGEVEIMNGFIVGKVEKHTTQTDADGLFQLTRLKGAKLSARVAKAGYEIDDRVGRIASAGSQSSPNDRMTFIMYKLRGAEPMVHKIIESRVPYDGTSATFDLTTGNKTDDGDLRITLLRSPLKIRRGLDKFDWAVKFQMLKGGFSKENDPYPYWAPENNYQPLFETSMSSNNVMWSGELKQNFYIKNEQGKYGRLSIDLSTDATRPDTGITIETWVNPSGSQNLEFDPAKQIINGKISN